MINEKKNIIINEIHYWKNNKLLPDTYCDFLLALYTEGNDVEIEMSSQKSHINTFFHIFLHGLLLVLLTAMLLVIYFTELSFVLQISLVFFCLVCSIFVTAYFIRKRVFFQVPLSLIFLETLIATLSVVDYTTSGDPFWIGTTVVINCLLWIVSGSVYRVLYLLISGIVGLMIFILITIV